MPSSKRKRTIVMADDDADDRALLRDAFREAQVENRLEFVADGRELLDFLRKCAQRRERGSDALPAFVLLDLNMPHMDGIDALLEIRSDPQLRHVPILVFSTSTNARDVLGCYAAGANSYLVKPSSFGEFIGLARQLSDYWLGLVSLPQAPGHAAGA
jgi:two-component system response regulator